MENDKRERQLERLRNWYKNLSEEQKAKRRDQQREYRRKLRASNPEQVNDYKRQNRAENKDRINERQRQYYEQNRERWRAYRARVNPEDTRRWIRESYRRNHKERTWRRFESVFQSREEFEGIYDQTLNGPCDVCGCAPNGERVLCIDHDHATMRFRGVLCSACNTVIERALKNPKLRQRFADYFDRERGQ